MERSNPPAPWLAAWIGIALLLRLLWVLHLPSGDAQIAALPDQQEYLNLGRNLLKGKGLVFYDPRFHSDVYAYRTPGYPMFVALCGGSVGMVRVAQAVIDSSAVLAVYLLAAPWLGPKRSLFAAALVAINPLLIYFTGLILAETLFTAMLVWGMRLVTSRGRWWVGCLLLALSVMVRPSALLLPIFLAALNPARAWPYQWRRAGIATFILLIVLIPWAWRNDARLGTWIWTTTNGGITLYDGFNAHADGSSDQSFVSQMPELGAMGEVERSNFLSYRARQFIEGAPFRVIPLTIGKLLRTWSPIPLSREYGHNARYVAIGLLYTLPLFVLTIGGLLSDRLSVLAKVFLLLPAVYITLMTAASVGSIRYRVPADVPMAVLAAAGKRTMKEER